MCRMSVALRVACLLSANNLTVRVQITLFRNVVLWSLYGKLLRRTRLPSQIATFLHTKNMKAHQHITQIS